MALGEVEALAALARGEVDAVLLSNMMYGRALAPPVSGPAPTTETSLLPDPKPHLLHNQKVIEIAPAWNLPMKLRKQLQDDAVRLTSSAK